MDFGEGDADNATGGFCSFPQVMGHEGVADVVALGAGARGLEVGQRVVLNPWLSCGPRAIEPPCPACVNGDYSLCWSFTDGDIKPGIHTGVSADVTGGYAEPTTSTWLPRAGLTCVPCSLTPSGWNGGATPS
jgi:threonine dehydrogenase-like Zn-dependent dehydrogenase